MIYFQYDKTMEGLLTAVFDAFYRKQYPQRIIVQGEVMPLFTEVYEVVTDAEKAERVLSGLRNIISGSAVQMLFVSYLYETDNVEMHIFNYIRKTLELQRSIEMDFADPDVLELSKRFRKVQREEEHMRQFVRFQKTTDGIFFACIEPLYDVLPLSAGFFEDRFADQPWLIYDAKRQYGLYYDMKKTEIVRFENPPVFVNNGQLSPDQMDEHEKAFQDLWKQYFKSAAIKERVNLKLQRQHMPKRFWKYLTEKQP